MVGKPHLILPTRYSRKAEEARFLNEVKDAMATAVENSFAPDAEPMRKVTVAELKRRMDVAIQCAKTMRFDYQWSAIRVRSTLDRAVLQSLRGQPIDIDKESKRTVY